MKCQRCIVGDGKYTHYMEDGETGEMIKQMVCWECDHDLINGGDWSQDVGELLMEREENNYEYDPLYYPKPSWYQ